jgi:uncharacterized BrkB/YihY/UPF0761 family membrane protein
VIGDQLGRPEGLQGSTGAVVAGILIAFYGSLGLGTAIQNAMNIAWSVPRNSRPNPFLLRLKSLLLLVITGAALFAVTTVSVLLRETEAFGGEQSSAMKWLITVINVLLVAAVLAFLLRLASAHDHSWWHAIPGALLVAVLWQVLQVVSARYVDRVLGETSSMNQTFGLILGLVGLIFLAATIGIFGIELNVVIVRRLWPRALLTPFTDSVELTSADREAYTSYARAQRHKGFEEVTVKFAKSPRQEADEAAAVAEAEQSSQARDPEKPAPRGDTREN